MNYQIPPGFKLVPIEPTEEMIQAMVGVISFAPIDTCHVDDRVILDGQWQCGSFDDGNEYEGGVQGRETGSRRIYGAMLAAALQPSQFPIQEPIAWLHRVKRSPQFVRTVYHLKRTEEEIAVIEADGDELVPLYAEQPPILPDRDGDSPWQSIETAPKDGRDVLLLMRDGRILEADWQSIDGHDHAWIGVVCGLRYEGDWGFTHWMPPIAAKTGS